ncbi:alanine racemase C-terminal domain-containing protein [Microbacterium karelineae]|uniref:alanine racemase C-terminal domain-containing protein n=1 Tax=Microbacterium karelineae TaxID=2654283 RepID=UPI001E54D201|nr:alanine racemase C-terminal domain-containing protein [Microbacterium karelineae]
MSAPRARVSRSALEANIARAAAGDPDASIDLRRDACGHGARIVAAAARAAGVTRALADDPAVAAAEGLREARTATLPLESVFGLRGRGEPVLTLATPVLQTKRLRAGDGVSYGYLHRADEDTRAALVAGGYAQGVPRAIGGRAAVLIAGVERPVIGRVAMDVCVVDIGDLEVRPGDEAVFFGGPAPDLLGRWARATGWSEIELVAAPGLSARREVAA